MAVGDVGNKQGESRSYVTESPALVRKFFKCYPIPKEAVILSDLGNSFVEQGKSVLLSLGFHKHICYPAAVHQYLSPNDNRLHGTAKKTWRELGLDYKDDVKSSISLLRCLDIDIQAQSKMWFDRNMIRLNELDVENLVGMVGGRFSRTHKSWLSKYYTWMNLTNQTPVCSINDDV